MHTTLKPICGECLWIWPLHAPWCSNDCRHGVAAIAALVLSGCASLGAYAQAHPDVVQRAETAVQLAQCVDQAVVAYQRQQVAATAAAVTTLPPPAADGGVQ